MVVQQVISVISSYFFKFLLSVHARMPQEGTLEQHCVYKKRWNIDIYCVFQLATSRAKSTYFMWEALAVVAAGTLMSFCGGHRPLPSNIPV